MTDPRTTPLAPLSGIDAAAGHGRRGIYDLVIMAFCVFLLLSNIGATKLIEFGPILTDGGAILFPLTYILGDVLTEVYGLRGARRAIIAGFAVSILASLTFWLVQIAPAAADYPNQAAFEAVLGVVPRFVLASICGYLVGQFLNAWVLVKIKSRTGEKALWARLLGSTVVGEFADTLVFAAVAWIGVLAAPEFIQFVLIGFVYKTAVEVVMLPVTYRVIAVIKRQEGIAVR
ncbi:queuosine precursor transporter [Nakamurella deserti]|uniref:queuosine precursor transporter n=1 Tax=Nakamurella deserti TaxID=2164074 RepID=UPI001F0B9594|nr:queuosine precursor transporter [Nakamurella deserti]